MAEKKILSNIDIGESWEQEWIEEVRTEFLPDTCTFGYDVAPEKDELEFYDASAPAVYIGELDGSNTENPTATANVYNQALQNEHDLPGKEEDTSCRYITGPDGRVYDTKNVPTEFVEYASISACENYFVVHGSSIWGDQKETAYQIAPPHLHFPVLTMEEAVKLTKHLCQPSVSTIDLGAASDSSDSVSSTSSKRKRESGLHHLPYSVANESKRTKEFDRGHRDYATSSRRALRQERHQPTPAQLEADRHCRELTPGSDYTSDHDSRGSSGTHKDSANGACGGQDDLETTLVNEYTGSEDSALGGSIGREGSPILDYVDWLEEGLLPRFLHDWHQLLSNGMPRSESRPSEDSRCQTPGPSGSQQRSSKSRSPSSRPNTPFP